MYASNQINGLAGYLGEVRQGPNGDLYQLGEAIDDRGNIGLAWQPYDQPQLGEVRQGTDGQLYQYSMDGLGNVGFAPLAALAAKALPTLLPTISKAIPSIANAIPGVSNLVRGLLPGAMPRSSGPFPTPPLPAIPGTPATLPNVTGPFRQPFSGSGRNFFINQLAPRIANATADLVIEKIKPLLATSSSRRSGRRGRRGVSGVGEDSYLYGVGERDYEGMGEQDYGLAYDDLGENDPYLSDSTGYGDYEPVNGMDGYVKGPISSGPAFVPREPASELWKPLW